MGCSWVERVLAHVDGDSAFVCVFEGNVLFVRNGSALVVVEFDHVDMTEEADRGWGFGVGDTLVG